MAKLQHPKLSESRTHGVADYAVIIVALIELAHIGIYFLMVGAGAALIWTYIVDDGGAK